LHCVFISNPRGKVNEAGVRLSAVGFQLSAFGFQLSAFGFGCDTSGGFDVSVAADSIKLAACFRTSEPV
jgi:hypothetical protein